MILSPLVFILWSGYLSHGHALFISWPSFNLMTVFLSQGHVNYLIASVFISWPLYLVATCYLSHSQLFLSHDQVLFISWPNVFISWPCIIYLITTCYIPHGHIIYPMTECFFYLWPSVFISWSLVTYLWLCVIYVVATLIANFFHLLPTWYRVATCFNS